MVPPSALISNANTSVVILITLASIAATAGVTTCVCVCAVVAGTSSLELTTEETVSTAGLRT